MKPNWLDPQVVTILIIIHAVAGGIALFSGPGALMALKGGRVHRLCGKVFFFTMIVTGVLALIISNLPGHKNLFLFLIGIFSIYMVCTGYRYLSLDSLHKGQKPLPIDWILTITMALFGSILFLGGIAQLSGLWNGFAERSFGIVMLVFGGISLRMVIMDFRNYAGKINYRNQALQMHIIRMVGANIAAFTAFLVVNNRVLPNIIAWLLPTVIGVPIIFYWVNKQQKVKGMKIEPKS